MIGQAVSPPPDAERAGAQRLVGVGLLTAAASHEVKNLILAIRGQAQVGLMLGRPGAARESLRSILRATEDMGRWFSSLLDFASGNGRHSDHFRLSEAMDETLSLLGPLLRKRGITVAREYRTVPPMAGPSSPYRQVFFNVLLNAWEAMRETGGILTVRIRLDGEEAEVEVRDTGPGLPPGSVARIFLPLSSDRESGSGLGLFVAKRIVEGLGGTIGADGAPSGGARFRIRFPLRP